MTGSASNQDDSPRRPGLFPLASFAWTDQSSESDQASQDTREGDDHESQDDPFFDRESVLVAAPVLGPAVDPPDDGVPPDRSRTGQGRAPILPLWARTGRGIRAMVTWWVKDVGYVVGYHVVRLPKYAAKTLLYAPVGLFAGIGVCCAGPAPKRAIGL